LCHAMAPKRCHSSPTQCDCGSESNEAKVQAEPEQEQAEADDYSEVSTTSSEGIPDTATPATSSMQTWTSVPSRRRVKPQASHELATCQVEEIKPARVAKPPQTTRNSQCDEGSHMRRNDGGKGKGLLHFQRIEVGIEDDKDFRVVQRLIGPRGKNMQDIVTKSKGAKVWIIGRGSRSWEDNVGPLLVCVGAAASSTFDVAVGLVKELLDRVKEDHRKFNAA